MEPVLNTPDDTAQNKNTAAQKAASMEPVLNTPDDSNHKTLGVRLCVASMESVLNTPDDTRCPTSKSGTKTGFNGAGVEHTG